MEVAVRARYGCSYKNAQVGITNNTMQVRYSVHLLLVPGIQQRALPVVYRIEPPPPTEFPNMDRTLCSRPYIPVSGGLNCIT